MAHSPTIANVQTQLGLCADAIEDGDYSTAWTKYGVAEALMAGIEQDTGNNGAYSRLRSNLDSLARALEKVEARKSRASDKDRFIKTKATYGSNK